MAVVVTPNKNAKKCWSCLFYVALAPTVNTAGVCWFRAPKEETVAFTPAVIAEAEVSFCSEWRRTPAEVPDIPTP